MARRAATEALRACSLLGAGALALSACLGGGHPSATPTTVAKAPAQPSLVAAVTLVGTGAAAGGGDGLRTVDLSPPAVGGTALRARTTTVGGFPAAVALAPDGRTAYVAGYSAGTLTPVDLATGKAGRPIHVGTGPAGVAVSPDGRTAYVADAGATPLGDTLVPVDLATGKAGRPIRVGPGPEGVAISPDGRTAYVADAGAVVTGQSGAIGHEVTAVDLRSGAARTIEVGNAPEAIAVDPNGRVAYVANTNSGSITPIALPAGTAGPAIPLGGAPEGIVFAPGGATAWVTVASTRLASGGALVPIDVATSRTGAPIPVGKQPAGVALAPGGSTAWVADYGEGRLVPVRLVAPRGAGTPVAVAGGPYALVVARLVLSPAAQGAQRARPNR